MQPPALEAYSAVPLFNTKAVVHQTRVPAPTLRAWERRYRILTPQRGENAYRLYSERDIATVNWLRERVQSGMTISQAIALLRSLELDQPAEHMTLRHESIEREGRRHAATQSTPVPIERFGVDQLQESLLRQITRLDEHGVAHLLAQALAIYSVEDVCLEILTPAFHEMGRLWAEGELSSTAEHFGANAVRAQLESLLRSASTEPRGPLVFVGCAPGELHELGALMLALFLRRGGFRIVYLGQCVEEQSLVAAADELHPAAVLLSAAQPATAAQLEHIGARLCAMGDTRPLFAVGGQAFEYSPALAAQVSGVLLGADAQEAVRDLRKRLSA